MHASIHGPNFFPTHLKNSNRDFFGARAAAFLPVRRATTVHILIRVIGLAAHADR